MEIGERREGIIGPQTDQIRRETKPRTKRWSMVRFGEPVVDWCPFYTDLDVGDSREWLQALDRELLYRFLHYANTKASLDVVELKPLRHIPIS